MMRKDRYDMFFPLVSLVVVTYNNLAHTKKVIDCIKSQTYQNIEIVVVDGGSKDGTVDYLESLEFPRLVWLSEPDHGIYDAINKGIMMSTGEIIGCCYDYFTDDNTLTLIIEQMISQNVDAIHGDLNYIDQNGKVVRKWRNSNGFINTGWMPAHPTLYIKKNIYNQFGLYKTNYVISADYELMVRLFAVNHVSLGYIPKVLINMETGGTSTSSISGYWLGIKEAYKALKENNINNPMWITFLRFIRVFKQFI